MAWAPTAIMGCRPGTGSQLGGVGCSCASRGGDDGPRHRRAERARLSGETREVVEFCAGLPAPARVAYEAGPTGFTLARALRDVGVGCVVAAPGKIERPATDRVKTDRRDAERLVRLLMIDGLHPVRVPDRAEEALRDLIRAREDLRGDLMRARHGSRSCCCATTCATRRPAGTGRSNTATGSAGSISPIVARRSR